MNSTPLVLLTPKRIFIKFELIDLTKNVARVNLFLVYLVDFDIFRFCFAYVRVGKEYYKRQLEQ